MKESTKHAHLDVLKSDAEKMTIEHNPNMEQLGATSLSFGDSSMSSEVSAVGDEQFGEGKYSHDPSVELESTPGENEAGTEKQSMDIGKIQLVDGLGSCVTDRTTLLFQDSIEDTSSSSDAEIGNPSTSVYCQTIGCCQNSRVFNSAERAYLQGGKFQTRDYRRMFNKYWSRFDYVNGGLRKSKDLSPVYIDSKEPSKRLRTERRMTEVEKKKDQYRREI
uniref:Uncharacterized protein n=1 Tax=Caenorhabditis tropicalis TaxID=1561998 RepID=A0A1I7V0Q5_9PELO